MSRKPSKFTCLGASLGQPRASWCLKRPQGNHVKTRVWDPPRCSSQLHGVPDQPPEGVLGSEDSLLLESVALYTEAVSAPSLAAPVFTCDPAKRQPERETSHGAANDAQRRETTVDT